MDLKDLGFDDWFAGHAGTLLRTGQSAARVMTVDRGAFLVRGEQGETVAELSGRFLFTAESSPDLPCVGDWVCVAYPAPGLAIIHAVLPRKSFLRRKRPGKTVDFQMIAGNLDVAFIVQSCHYDFNIRRLDRYLVAVNEGHITPIIILSKTDLVDADEPAGMVEKIRQAGITSPLLPISNTTGKGYTQRRAVSCSPSTTELYCLTPPACGNSAFSAAATAWMTASPIFMIYPVTVASPTAPTPGNPGAPS